jgi:hypothetical protein
MLIIGNSVVNNGIDPASLGKEYFRYKHTNLRIAKINPDGTELWDWYFILKNFFVKVGHLPDVVVIGFAGELLRDGRPTNPSRLASSFCRIADLPELISQGMDNYKEVGEFLAASASTAFALRGAIRNRFLDMTIPNFAKFTPRINETLRKEKTVSVLGEVHKPTYELLNSLLLLLRKDGINVVLVAMPAAHGYELDPSIQEGTEEAGACFVDSRAVPHLSEKHFLDQEHLNQIGGKIYSKHLTKLLIDCISQQPDRVTKCEP